MSRLSVIFFVDMRLIAALIVAMFFFLRVLHAEECPLLKCVPCSKPDYGYIVDKATGCRTCQCKRTPCEDESHPHILGIFCGRGPTREPCPDGSVCLIAPNDAYAVCCPTRRRCRAG
jgi:hypothetical protein